MEKYLLGFAWLIATITAWFSFGAASWHWAEDVNNPGWRALTILWFVISLALFWIGLRFRNSDRK